MASENGPRKISRRDSLNLRATELMKKAELLARRISTPQPPPKLVVGLGQCSRRLAWCMVLFFHVFNGLYSMGLAYLYYYMSKPFMDYYATMLEMMAPEKYIWITIIYAVISALNWYSTFSMLLWSIYYRRLVFGRIKRRASPHAADVEASIISASAIAKTTKTKLSKTILRNLFRPIGVRGNMFDTVLLVREMVEIASQTYQAQSSSLLVSTVWMNQVFALLICINCVTGVVVHAVKEEEIGQRRLLCTVIDLMLDFAWGFILPANIIFNYIPMFVSNGYAFPPSFYSSDTAFTKALLECKQFFIISWADAFTTILPYINMFSGLRNMKVLLLCDFNEDKIGGPYPSKVVPGLPVALERISGHDVTVDETDASEDNFPYEVHADHDALTVHGMPHAGGEEEEAKSNCQKVLLKLIHALVVGVGVFVVVTSVVASHVFGSNPCGQDCKLQMRPWFTSHCACSVQEIDCYGRHIDGNETEMSEILGTLDDRVLNFLMVSHCPAMAVPSDIQRFPRLLGLQFYNTSILDWPKESALSQKYFPRLGYVYIVRSRLDDGIPEGLTTDLAHSIIDIELVATHIGRSFPPDIADAWSGVMELLVERCGLQEFPTALASIPSVLQLSLAYNNISVIPDQLPILPNWQLLDLDGNPLQVLPASIDDSESMAMLTIQDTHVEAMPPKLQARLLAHQMNVAGHNTPLCKDDSDASTSLNSSSSEDVAAAEAAVYQQTRVVCVLRPDVFPTGGMFALAAVDALRGIK